jgi:general stress protein 26
MSLMKTLFQEDAIEKIKEIASDRTCFCCSHDDDKVFSTPMKTRMVDDEGSIWFIGKNQNTENPVLLNKSNVTLLYQDHSKQQYLSLNGVTTVVHYDIAGSPELQSPVTSAWLEEAENEPGVMLIKITPEEGHYWDTKNGRCISLLKTALSAITGSKFEPDVQGDIILK